MTTAVRTLFLTTPTVAEIQADEAPASRARVKVWRGGVVLACGVFGLDTDDDAIRVARAQISNERLLQIGRRNRPPQWWYDRDEEDLF